MIILPKYKLVIITPPKTGSIALHKALCNDKFGGVAAYGNSIATNNYDHHVSGACRGYKTLVSVRHPLDRLVSLWFHHVRDETFYGRASPAFWLFANFVGRREVLTNFYLYNISRYVEYLGDYEVIRIEHINEDLKKYGIDDANVDVYFSTSFRERNWRPYYGDRNSFNSLLHVLSPWAEPDAKLGGYDWPPVWEKVDFSTRKWHPPVT